MRIILRLAWAVPAICFTLRAQAPAWTTVPAFSLSPQDLRTAAANVPPRTGYAATHLLQDEHVTVDDSGRRTIKTHQLFRVEQMSGLEFWSIPKTTWDPWLHERPVIRARVITAEGQEVWIDPATIGESAARPADQQVLSDRKEMHAPLPKLAPGALAEVEITTRESRPFSKAGVRNAFGYWSPSGIEFARFVLEAPTSPAFRFKLGGFPSRPVARQSQGGRTTYQVDLGRLPPMKLREIFQAPDQEPAPLVQFTSVPSWQAAAREYEDLVEAQLKGADLKDWAAKAVAGAREREVVIERLLEAVQKAVRYTGLEFGEAAIVPRTPGEVLQRGYGDCKDKATLLVGLLRTQGIEAHVALLWAGVLDDVEPDMPGLGWFDHAIVHVPGKSPLWIDPTVRHARAGLLPVQDQGRLALVASGRTKALLRTPETDAGLNLTHTTLDVHFSPEGPGRIVEILEGKGLADLELRGGHSGVEPGRLKDFLTSYGLPLYQGKTVDKVNLADPDDLAVPFRRSFEVGQSAHALTGTKDAMANMNPWMLVRDFDGWIRPGSAQANTGGGGSSQVDPAGRRTEALFPQAYTSELKWVLHPPAGFTHGLLPDREERKFGPAWLTTTYLEGEGGTIEVLMRFVCPQRRWTSAQIREAKAALEAYQHETVPRFFFKQKAEASLAEGRVGEALEEFRKGVRSDPGRVSPWARLARVQVQAGLGLAARASARKAVDLDPKSAEAQECLGFTLEHDLAGRRFKPGWDRKGALAALREALRLEPERRSAILDLGQVLERGADGLRQAGPDMEEAVRLYRQVRGEEKLETLDEAIIVCLATLGRFEEARVLAQSYPNGEGWRAWEVAMTACTKGVRAAVTVANGQASYAKRSNLLVMAGNQIARYRKYAEAAALLKEGADGSEDPADARRRAELAARLRPGKAADLSATQPRHAPLRFLIALFQDPVDLTLLNSRKSIAQLPLAAEDVHGLRRRAQERLQLHGRAAQEIQDILLTAAETTAEGNDALGYKVDIQLPGHRHTMYVAAEFGTYRLVSMEAQSVHLARQAMWAVEKGRLEEAGAWLDRAAGMVSTQAVSDALAGHPLVILRQPGKAQSAYDLRLAAAAAIAMGQVDLQSEDILRSGRLRASDSRVRGALGVALCNALLRKGPGQELEALTHILALNYPESWMVEWLRARSLTMNGQWSELLTWAERGLRAAPEEPEHQRWKAKALLHLKRSRESEAIISAQMNKGKAEASEFSEIAWSHAGAGQASARSLDLAKRGTEDPKLQNPDTLHTLAVVQAELGHASEARNTLVDLLERTFSDELRPEDWYVLGRLAEGLGEADAAKGYYQRVEIPLAPSVFSDKRQVRAMARERLRALGVPLPSEPSETKPPEGKAVKRAKRIGNPGGGKGGRK